MSDVFISYSRNNKPFADRLVAELERDNRSVWIDRVGIRFTTEWWEEIKHGIVASDNFVLIMSPDSMSSPVCHLEIEYARNLTKKIVPIYLVQHQYDACKERFGERLYKDDKDGFLLKLYGDRNPMQLFETNWNILPGINRINAAEVIEAYAPHTLNETKFMEEFFPALREALNVDIIHARQHTRLYDRAQIWDKSGKQVSFLLNDAETKEAEEWLQAWEQDTEQRRTKRLPPKNPQPDDLLRAYIAESRWVESELQEKDARRERLIRWSGWAIGGLVLVVLVAALVSVISFQQVSAGQNQLATVQNDIATSEAAGTQIARDVMENHALFMADLSRQQLKDNHSEEALLLGLESLRYYATLVPYPGESSAALQNALEAPGLESAFLLHDDAVLGAIWNNDESRILSWSWDATVRVWDAASRANLLTLRHDDYVTGAAWNSDESRILSWSDDGTTRVWDAMSGVNLFTLRHDDVVVGAGWNSDESRILSWSYDGTVRVWDATSGANLLTLRHDSCVNGAAWNEDGSRILSWSDDRTVRVWDAASGANLLTLRHDWTIWSAVWSKDESRILSWSGDETVRVWDAASGTNLLTLHVSGLSGAVWSKDESGILSWSTDGTVRVWDAARGDNLLTLRHDLSQLGVIGATWSENENQILSWSDDRTVRVWGAPSGVNQLIMRHDSTVLGAAWSKNGSYILSWSSDGTVRVWDAASGTNLLILNHERYVDGAVWNEAGSRILSWSDDGTVRMWDTARVATLRHDYYMTGTEQVWPGDVPQLIALAQSRKTRELSNEQRVTFFLPTLPPTATIFLPSVTPMPTVTPSPQMPTITPPPTLTPLSRPQQAEALPTSPPLLCLSVPLC
jgi:WD40 repeat protein